MNTCIVCKQSVVGQDATPYNGVWYCEECTGKALDAMYRKEEAMVCCKCKVNEIKDVAKELAYEYVEDNDDDDEQPFVWRICNTCCTQILFNTMIRNEMWESKQ